MPHIVSLPQTLFSMVKYWKHNPKIRNKTRVFTFTTVIQHSSESSSYSNQRRKRNKRIQIRKEIKLHCLQVTRYCTSVQFSSFQSLSCVRLFATPWTAVRQASLSITNSRSSPKVIAIESVIPSSHLILCRPLLLLPPIPPSIRVFSNESTLHMRWPEFWSFSLSISASSEHPGLISFRMD